MAQVMNTLVNFQLAEKMLHENTVIELDALAQEIRILEGVPGANYGIARAIFKNPMVGVPAALGAMAAKTKSMEVLENPAMRDLLIKFDQVPPREMSTTGAEIMKRMAETLQGSVDATWGQVPRLEAQAEWRAEESQIPQSTAMGISR